MPVCNKCKKDEEVTDGLCPACTEAELTSSQSNSKVTPCPCGDGPVKVSEQMQCNECTMWWHPSCVGLDGLTHYMTKKLSNWKCPVCYKLDRKIIEKLELNQGDLATANAGDEALNKILRDEVKAIIPEVVEEIKAGVKMAFQEDAVKEFVSGAKEAMTRSWAEVAKTEQKKVIKEVVEQTSDVALQKGLGKISADLSEQKNRSRNCVVSNIPEDDAKPLIEVVTSYSDLNANDIADTKRLGEQKNGENRLILVRFKSEDVAQEFHNYGRGRHLGSQIWVNPDLTKTERTARFQMRKERREKRPPIRTRGGTVRAGNGPQRASNGPVHVAGGPGHADGERGQSNQD